MEPSKEHEQSSPWEDESHRIARVRFVDPDRFLDCVHCGLCIPSCPTFLELGTEMDSPRGRIQLMRDIHEGGQELDDPTVSHLDGCLGCRACETICPAGVRYGEMIEGTRALVEKRHTRPFLERWQRWAINRVFPSPWMMRRLRALASLSTALRIDRMKSSPWVPAPLRRVLRYLPDRHAGFSSSRLPREIPAEGVPRFRVGLLAGCVMQGLFGETLDNTVALLRQNGCDIYVPRGAACCGALLLHNGAAERGRALGRGVVRAFDAQGLDAVITNAAGCGAAMKDYAIQFRDDPELCDAAARVSAKVEDIAAFLFRLPDLVPRRGVTTRVTYHDACHLLNGQGVGREPRELLCRIPGLELVELAETEICCGSAGTYNLTQPEMARRLGERKAQHIEATGAEAVVTGNPGCVMQIRAALRDRGVDMRVLHTADLLAQAYTDVEARGSGRGARDPVYAAGKDNGSRREQPRRRR